MPKDTIDQPCDVILVVEHGKQFKAHRQVLSEASPFFEKLLNSDMKESKEGVVRLEMFSEFVMGNTLEYIYTGNIEILSEENAQDLIVMADYLFLQNLKTLAGGVLLQTLNVSNCLSTFFFFERHQCEELFSKTQKFILANFSAVYAANRIEVLNMSSREIEMFISSDEINVNAEEDVFNIILSWIDHDRTKRKKYFAELFRHVRLVYVSRDFLCKDIVTNDLVKDREGCLDLVEDAMKLIESKDFSNLSVTPRKSLETSVIVIKRGKNILCYFPREDKWCNLGSSCLEYTRFSSEFVSCRGNLYTLHRTPDYTAASPWRETCSYELRLVRYNPFSNKWMLLPWTGNKTYRYVHQIFVTKEDEMYALEAVESLPWLGCRERKEKHVFFITKYKPESNSWEDISSFDLGRRNFCIVAKDDFIYFIGGAEYEHDIVTTYLTDVDRYDLRKDQWNKVADIHEGCTVSSGSCGEGKIFCCWMGSAVKNKSL
ncbi:kelch-like protein 2 [Oculina patagonica]